MGTPTTPAECNGEKADISMPSETMSARSIVSWGLEGIRCDSCGRGAHMTEQPDSSRSFLTLRATRAASVKASLTPRLRIAEHSR